MLFCSILLEAIQYESKENYNILIKKKSLQYK